MRIRHYFVGEHIETISNRNGIYPVWKCGHRHKNKKTAEQCMASFRTASTVYVELDDGHVMTIDKASELA